MENRNILKTNNAENFAKINGMLDVFYAHKKLFDAVPRLEIKHVRIYDNTLIYKGYIIIGKLINNIAHVKDIYNQAEVIAGLTHNGYNQENQNLIWTTQPETAGVL
ncbi:MAG: hypothetical protein WC725_04875 [Patescibacteria group bacterium]